MPRWTARFKLRRRRRAAFDNSQRRMLLGRAAAVLGLAPMAAHAAVLPSGPAGPKAKPAQPGLTEHQRTYYRLARF